MFRANGSYFGFVLPDPSAVVELDVSIPVPTDGNVPFNFENIPVVQPSRAPNLISIVNTYGLLVFGSGSLEMYNEGLEFLGSIPEFLPCEGCFP
jgi:hypothetical protein